MTTDPTAQRIAALQTETLTEWIVRFHAERGLPAPGDAEIAELLRLNALDERTAHQ